jgi:hypothetical protein
MADGLARLQSICLWHLCDRIKSSSVPSKLMDFSNNIVCKLLQVNLVAREQELTLGEGVPIAFVVRTQAHTKSKKAVTR